MSDSVTPWTVARQAPLSTGFPRQEYWSGLPFPSLGDLPDPGIKPGSLAFQADALTSEPPGKAHNLQIAAMFTLLMLSPVHLFATLWTVAHQAPLSMRFFRQGFWSGLPCPPPGDLPNPGIEPRSPALQADSLLTELQGKPYEIILYYFTIHIVNSELPWWLRW